MKTTTIILLLIYVLSGIFVYLYSYAYYSKKGHGHNETPILFEFVLIFIPILNTIGAIFAWFMNWPFKEGLFPWKEKTHDILESNKKWLNKFFGIK